MFGPIELFLAATPAICFAFIIGIEIPQSWRERMFVHGFGGFKPPLFVYTVLYGFFVKATLMGVLGSYGIFITDIVSYLLLVVIASRTQWQYNKRIKKTAKSGLQVIQGGKDGKGSAGKHIEHITSGKTEGR